LLATTLIQVGNRKFFLGEKQGQIESDSSKEIWRRQAH